MAAQPSQEEVEQLKLEVFQAAREGRTEDLRSTLSNLNPDLVKEVLHHQTRSLNYTHRQLWRGTPLSTAALRGHLEVVKLLVEDFKVDLDQRVEAEILWSVDVTALMCASWGGHLDIVKLLVTKGCAVNLAQEGNQTAVYLACQKNRVEVVKYLVENGAQIDDDVHGGDGRTCLMTACPYGSDELVEYLVEKGANVNKETDRKLTALHLAASGNAVKKVDILLRNGAMMSRNLEDRTPLMEAAWYRSTNVVSFFAQSSYVSRKEKIDSLELLGARTVMWDTTAALRYLRQAMAMRHEDPREIIPKPYFTLPAPSNVEESRTLEELEARELYPDRLRLECLATAWRVLGPWSKSFARFCCEHSLDLRERGHSNDALTVIILGEKVREGLQMTECGHSSTLFRLFASLLFDMMTNGQPPKFSSLCEILKISLEILRQNQPACHVCYLKNSEDFEGMYLYCISVGLEVAKGQEEMATLQKLAKSLVHLQPSPFRGTSVLHAAVSTGWDLVRCNIAMEDLHVDSVVSFLLQCDADVNAVDNNRNRPLHILAKCPEGHFDPETLRNLTRTLVEAGAPVSVLNTKGQTPLHIAITEEVADVLREFYPVSLQSLSATAVVKHGIPFAGQVPEILEEFLRRH